VDGSNGAGETVELTENSAPGLSLTTLSGAGVLLPFEGELSGGDDFGDSFSTFRDFFDGTAFRFCTHCGFIPASKHFWNRHERQIIRSS
jgi:hypothetical protein